MLIRPRLACVIRRSPGHTHLREACGCMQMADKRADGGQSGDSRKTSPLRPSADSSARVPTRIRGAPSAPGKTLSIMTRSVLLGAPFSSRGFACAGHFLAKSLRARPGRVCATPRPPSSTQACASCRHKPCEGRRRRVRQKTQSSFPTNCTHDRWILACWRNSKSVRAGGGDKTVGCLAGCAFFRCTATPRMMGALFQQALHILQTTSCAQIRTRIV